MTHLLLINILYTDVNIWLKHVAKFCKGVDSFF